MASLPVEARPATAPPNTILLDALIVGHGLAGAVLAHTLHRAGQRVLVLDRPQSETASRVAAGLVNPLAGRRFALTWRADELLPAAAAFYRSLDAELGLRCWHELPIHKLFGSPAEANAGAAKAGAGGGAFLAGLLLPPPADPPGPVRAPLGGLMLAGGGFLQTEPFLDALVATRARLGQWRSEAFVFQQLQLAADGSGVRYTLHNGVVVTARRVIFCEGAAVAANPWFGWLPVQPNAGEVLDVTLPAPLAGGPTPEAVLNGGVYVVPHGEGRWRVGATYARLPPAELRAGITLGNGSGGSSVAALPAAQVPSPAPAQPVAYPTAEGRAELLAKLAQVVVAPATVRAHRAGLRPTVPDRRPLVGPHPAHPALWVFNGLGSKGVGTAPALAAHVARVLAGAEPLWPDVALARYHGLWPG